MKALIADDDSFAANVLQQMLQALGAASDVVPNGLVCCETLESNPGVYHVVFMDVFMPEMDGVEATQAIKSLNLGSVQKVIGVTGDNDAALLQRCHDAGMDDIIVKPIRRDRLQSVLKSLT